MTTPTKTSSAHWAALPVLLAGSFMVVLDFFIVNVALPSIATDLNASESSLEWVVAAYGLTFAAFLVTAGRLGDELGRRRVFAVGLALFTLFSAVCGIASDPTALVLARALQGLSGAVVMPQVLSIIGVSYRDSDYTKALSAYGVVLGLAAVGGQVIGGALVQSGLGGLGWRGCFLINVPIGIVALALTYRLVRESRAPSRTKIDLPGALALALALTAVLLPLIEGRQHGWPVWASVSLAVAPMILAGFVARQSRLSRRGGSPLVDLKLFRVRAFSVGLVTQLLLAGAQASFFVYLALYLQQARGLSPLQAGLAFSILAVAFVAVSGPAPALTEKFGRAVVFTGGISLTLGLGSFAAVVERFGSGGPILALVPSFVLVGAGIGLCLTPLTSTVLGSIDPKSAGAASGVLSTTQQVGYALGVAVTGVVFFGAGGAPAHAFELALVQLTMLAVGIVVTTAMLPRRAATA